MYEIEIWIDIVLKSEARIENLCTLFCRQRIPMRPIVGERLSFFQGKDTSYRFNLVTDSGVRQNEHSLSVEIEDVSHYACPDIGGVTWNTSVRCEEIAVESKGDGRSICLAMQTLGFEVDPYNENNLAD